MKFADAFSMRRRVETNRCDACGKMASRLEVAHCVPKWIDRNLAYDRFTVVLCRPCHRQFERELFRFALRWLDIEPAEGAM